MVSPFAGGHVWDEFHTDTTVYSLLSPLAQSVHRLNYHFKMIQKRNAEYLEISTCTSQCKRKTNKH